MVALSAIMPSRAIIAVTVRKLSIGVPAKRNEEGRMYKPILVLIAYLRRWGQEMGAGDGDRGEEVHTLQSLKKDVTSKQPIKTYHDEGAYRYL